MDIFYAHIEGLAFGLAQPDRARAKQTWSSSLPVPGKAAGGKAESCWGRASAQQNDSDLGASLTRATAQDKQTRCCFCYSLQGSSFGRGSPPSQARRDPCPCLPLVAQEQPLCYPPDPHASPAPPASSLGPSLASLFCGSLAKPSAPLLGTIYLHETAKGVDMKCLYERGRGLRRSVWDVDNLAGMQSLNGKVIKENVLNDLTSMLSIYPYHHSLIFSAE